MTKGRSKFNVDRDKGKRTYDGIVFDSVLEMRFYRDYVLPKMELGEIIKCERQIRYVLQEKYTHVQFNGTKENIRAIDYKADFVLTFANGHEQVVDTKGFPDSTALLKRKIFWFKYPEIDYIWMSYSKKDGGWINYDELKKLKKTRRKNKA